eukprot:TRINITY_DN4606_c0_g1_i1.p1 TRINITY_DN4606_c0_g1~~TRINITY_DN4606_c0_g1_i1.p1  ORF type:complete len:465 (-),score=186.88 TRINITY_DN4606_c0_g1_i1:41-1435(-)
MADSFNFQDPNLQYNRLSDFAYRDLNLAWMENQARLTPQHNQLHSQPDFGDYNEINNASAQLGELVRGGFNATNYWPRKYTQSYSAGMIVPPPPQSLPPAPFPSSPPKRIKGEKRNQSNEEPFSVIQSDDSDLDPENYQAPPQQAIPNSEQAIKAGMKRKSAEEREQARAEQQRKASRKYREKKKVLVEQLEDKLKDIVSEKEALESDHKKALEQIIQLKQEAILYASKPVQNPVEEMSKHEKERLAVLKKLDDLYRSGASDQQLMEVITEAENICRKIVGCAECHYKFLISPSFVSYLNKSGFFGPEGDIVRAEPLNPQGAPDSIRIFVTRTKEIVGSELSNEQIEKMDALADKYFVDMEIVKAEKEHLNRDISLYFDSTGRNGESNADISKVLQAVSTLEILRRTMQDESKLALTTMNTIVCLLKPRQRAKFHLQVDYTHRAVEQLKKLWEAMKNGNATKFV